MTRCSEEFQFHKPLVKANRATCAFQCFRHGASRLLRQWESLPPDPTARQSL